jgi:hypothetical protein
MRNNPIIVQKYGGACLETPAKICAVASSLSDLHSRGPRIVATPPNLGGGIPQHINSLRSKPCQSRSWDFP